MHAGGKDKREANYLNSLRTENAIYLIQNLSKCLAKESTMMYKYIFH